MASIHSVRHSLSIVLLHAWRYLLGEPLKWIFLCFFQPTRFRENYEQLSLMARFVCSLRLLLPVFLLAYILNLLTLPIRILFQAFYFSAGPITPLQLLSVSLYFIDPLIKDTALGIGVGFLVGMLFSELSVSVILAIALGVVGLTVGKEQLGIFNGLGFACALGLVGGTSRGFKWGVIPGIVASLIAGAFWTASSLAIQEVGKGIAQGIQITCMFFVSYIIGSSRLLLYVASGSSGWQAYRKSINKPEQVFVYLRHSSLHWDEYVFLPFPRLRQTLRIAMGQNTGQTLQELSFIFRERPAQREVALNVLAEITLHDMSLCETIQDIAQAHHRLDELWTPEIKQAASRWTTPFMRLADTARDVEKYCTNLNWQMRHEGLEKSLVYLDNIYLSTALPDARLNQYLEEIVTQWRQTIRQKKEELEQGADVTGQIRNPYIAGDALKAQDALFVGRRDIVRQLSESLSYHNNRPTFLLNGERRMGKSSTLRQLPHLLGASYIPIFYDLQYRKPAGIDLFLNSIAQEVYQALSLRGIDVEPLKAKHLEDALQRNEAAIYRPFDAWLDTLESVLKEEGRTILLLFDEFEKLEEVRGKYLDLNLLLDWFRGTIQNRTHVALLFSGVQTITELGAHWASRFVNVKMLKLSFLRPAEARDLIIRPVPQSVFSPEVIEEILRVTQCHPFLVQAVCAALIHELNSESKKHAVTADVATAVTQVLESWDGYFLDQWERTDANQRSCLTLLLDGEAKDFSMLLRQSNLEYAALQQALQILLRRDLILREHGYQIATPIMQMWLKRNI